MLRKARKLVKRYGLRRGTIDADRLAEIIERQGYTIVKFRRGKNDADLENMLNLLGLLEYTKKYPSFAYADENNRILFISQGLSDEEYEILYWHELAHIIQGHVLSPDNSIIQENDSHHFVMLVKAYIAVSRITKYALSAAALILLVFALTLAPNKDGEIFSTVSAPAATHPSNSITPAPTLAPTPIPTPVSTSAPEQSTTDAAASEIVYVAPSGKKFHKRTCSHIRNLTTIIELPFDKAVELKYVPCSDCYCELY